jgi:hypothetical protein
METTPTGRQAKRAAGMLAKSPSDADFSQRSRPREQNPAESITPPIYRILWTSICVVLRPTHNQSISKCPRQWSHNCLVLSHVGISTLLDTSSWIWNERQSPQMSALKTCPWLAPTELSNHKSEWSRCEHKLWWENRYLIEYCGRPTYLPEQNKILSHIFLEQSPNQHEVRNIIHLSVQPAQYCSHMYSIINTDDFHPSKLGLRYVVADIGPKRRGCHEF